MLRKNISYVEDSFSADCKDAVLRVKPFFITRKEVSRAVRKALRDESKNWLQDYIKDKEHLDIFYDLINNRLQKLLSLKLKKIYPLALCEIRVLKIEKLKEQEELKTTTEKIKKSETEEKIGEKKVEEDKKEDNQDEKK